MRALLLVFLLPLVAHGAGKIINVDVAASGTANIARNKLAAGTAYAWCVNDVSGFQADTAVTASRAVTTDANGAPVASATTATELGYVSGVTSAIQTQLNGKALSTRLINTTAPITGGGDLSADRTLACNVASGSVAGCLSAADWTTFNGKQAAGSYITALTGDVTASGPGSVAATVAKVNGVAYGTSPGTNTIPVVTSANTVTYETAPVAAGGTGQVSLAAHATLVGNGTSGITAVGPSSSTAFPLVSGGVSADPAYALLGVAGGGTGAATLTAHGVVLGNGTSAVSVTAAGTAGQALVSNGASTDPSFKAVLSPGWTNGMVLSNDASPNTKMDIAAGSTVDSTGVSLMTLASVLIKDISATWVVGSGNGGLDTGTVAAATWYWIWVIQRTDTGVVDALFSTSATSPTMPTNYTLKRRIGAMQTDGASHWLLFIQYANTFMFKTPVNDLNSGSIGTGTTTVSLSVPPFPVSVILGGSCSKSAAQPFCYIKGTDQTAFAADAATQPAVAGGNAFFGLLNFPTNASGQIDIKSSLASTSFSLDNYGWVIDRSAL